jgi:membrane protein required for colicin V production
VIRRLVHGVGLSGVDRLFGFGLGVVRGLFFACVLLLMLGLTSIPGKRAWHESAGVAVLLPVAEAMRGAMPAAMAQRIDLEGRGTSLQAEAERLRQAMPDALPAPIAEVLSEGRLPDGALAEGLPQALPEFLPQATETAPRTKDPKLVTPDPPSQGTPDDAQVL